MKPSISYPLDSISVLQRFGANRAYYLARFGENGHMGVDFRAPHGTPVYAAHDGVAMYKKDDHGGEGVHNLNKALGINTINWHLIGDTDPKFPPPIPMDGGWHPVKKGDLIGYADNTGAPFESSGDHLHFGLQFVDHDTGAVLNSGNGFGGCIDPTPYFDGTFARRALPNLSQTEAAAAVKADLTEISTTLQSAPTPQKLTLAGRALNLISQMIAKLRDLAA